MRDECKKELFDYLNKHSEQILEDAEAGDELAARVVDFYRMVQAFAEPIALAFLDIAVREYRAAKTKE